MGNYDKTTATKVGVMAEMVLDNPKKCVLCTIKWCVRGDLCSLPEGAKFRIHPVRKSK